MIGKAIGGKINLVSNISVTEYVGNFIFENGNLTTCLRDDGYMSFTSAGKPEFHYYIKDHLGSNRIVADENGNIEQKTHYYAYGGIIGDISTNPEEQKFKYNGKEYETMHGLNTYDYGARQYDGARILWDRMDQLCEKYYHINPYVYCAGNPVRFIDPDGLEPTPAEAAAMALHVYGDKDSQKANLGNWRVSKRNFGISLNTSNGLKSMVYEKVINGKVTEIFFIKYEFAKFLIVFNRMGFTEQQ